ncbi:DNA uptake transporter [Clostridioides difficile]|uniref:Metallo beta-lactamase superfamily lipoprotein n=5 Tax=Clostridioides difficile TaxID=1496 RepID=A0A9R0BLT7_CLODR|nr:MBL fold metallo-hydrolase [Clostridioides difficile]OFU04936.1 MBL fold hydrolase [Clostridium sp. HMSC19E03]OFU05255.1 MBL fold hydrolase [Clostridium sp. HMSC19D07]OFU15988.1 MBL fold hydrolase [Clostridium sp. HMSC19C08]OFU21089.1 MBL fold hydrolase [Clostridium sp. HMSC19C09]OFU25834.1 MBL fold hydrolase [Clostridium sp. HMSC19C05]OFU28490.1 MBL fold hydrolase [Clostridium sp. HMSC19B11]OFU36296.1 MBL fold hydrolase [Clostridium sp. HMSC19B10]OFU43235.1 MBL fold hydrolase [Clostridi
MRNKIFLSILIIISLLIGCDKKSLLSIHIIDVGQGDSILVQTPTNKNILIDGGDEDSENIIISYLRQKRIKTIDIIIATHPDSDHIGSLDNVIKKFNVNSIYMPEQSTDSEAYQNLINSCTDKNLSIQHLYKNDVLNIDNNINIYVLSPSYIQEESNLNSIVFKLTFNDNSFLFMGDAEEENEKEILHSFKLNNINFIKIGHHGSNSSSSLEFIKKISPDIAAISCGYKNQYGHPHREVINNLKQNHVSIYRTDRIGDIVFYSDGEIIFTKYNYEIDT